MSNTHGLAKGSKLVINMPNHPLDEIRAEYVRQSPRTGKCTVKLLETRGAYKKGDYVTINQAEMS